jgi:hypothetical protein
MERSGSERVLMASRMFDAARTMMLASFPPGLSERERKRMIYKRTYGEEAPADFPRSN